MKFGAWRSFESELKNSGVLFAQIEGTCSGRYGFIIAVTDILNTGKGTIREGTGSATFNVQYMCLVFRPFRGEVIDCVVSSVNKVLEAQRSC